MSVSIVYRYRCDSPGCTQVHDRERGIYDPFPTDVGWRSFPRAPLSVDRTYLCRDHAAEAIALREAINR